MEANKNIIVCAGMNRSGSTWIYNVLRFLHEVKGIEFQACWVDDRQEVKATVEIVKLHNRAHLNFPYTSLVTSHRDLREVINSLLRMGWIEADKTAVQTCLNGYIETLSYWRSIAVADIAFQWIKTDPAKAIKTIGSALEHPLCDTEVDQILSMLATVRSPKNGKDYDPVTLLHPDHISNAQNRSQLSPELADFIQQQFADWQVSNGYT